MNAESQTPASRLAHQLKQPIIFDGTATPVKTALFFIVCLAWILPGLVGRDPWKPDEAIAFGIIHNMLQGEGWIIPAIAGVPTFDTIPFAAWIAALSAALFSPTLPLHDGARMVSGLWIALTMLLVANAAQVLLDVRAGRISALMVIGSLGLLLRGHEISFALAPMTGTALCFYGLVHFDRHARRGGFLLGAGGALVALTAGLLPALLIVAVPVVVMSWKPAWRRAQIWRALAWATALTLCAAAAWPLLLILKGGVSPSAWLPAALGIQTLSVGGRPFDPLYFLRLLPWYALPALPIAIWAAWKERKQLSAKLEITLPLAAFAVMLLGFSLLREPRDDMAAPLLVPLILVAIHGLDRLPRSLASFVDWFGTAIFSFVALLIWSMWTGALTGVPRNAAKWVARELPGFVPELSWMAFALAVALTLVWLAVVVRTRRTNRRVIVNWCAGVTLIWMLVNLLWLPAIDHARSYRSTALAIKMALPDGAECVAQTGLGDAQRAAFHYHAGLTFVASRKDAQSPCNLLLLQGVRDKEEKLQGKWKLIWDGARPGDRAERFRLYARS